jgi:beta-phosphoglucomutase
MFDMDGVLVDSMPYHFLAWYETLIPYGVRVSCFEVYQKEGEHWEKSLRYFLRRARLRPTRSLMKRIFRERRVIFHRMYKRFLFKDAERVLGELKKEGLRLALVTGTPIRQVHRILPKSILGFFEAVIAGDSVRRGKPSPEPYKKAARALGVFPDECIVVENAPLGILSAKRAGMRCAGITTSLPAEYLTHADWILEDIQSVPGLLRRRNL